MIDKGAFSEETFPLSNCTFSSWDGSHFFNQIFKHTYTISLASSSLLNRFSIRVSPEFLIIASTSAKLKSSIEWESEYPKL